MTSGDLTTADPRSRILIVEDEGVIALDLRTALTGLGYAVVGIVSEGEKAIDRATELRPDLVLMDIRLRGKMDGVEAAEQILERLAIPVVYLTAYGDEPTLRRARVTHPFGYVLKPFEERDLHLTIQMALYRHQAENELRRARDQALQSARLKATFLANMSHEIRTPLNIILGYTGILAGDRAGLDSRALQSLASGVQDAAKRLMSTINGILDISRIETGNFEILPASLDLASILERHVEDFQVFAAGSGVTLNGEPLEHRPTIRFDEYCLSQSLMNLLQNAIKFTHRGGQITVSLDRNPDGALRLSIRDTGIGIDEAYLPHLFEPFSQEDAGYTRRFEGTGLGLALTKQYLELNGARMSVESRKGVGSIFRIHFSKGCEEVDGKTSSAASPPPGFAPATQPSTAARRTVLVVEDDPDQQVYMKRILEDRCEVLLAGNGDELRQQLVAHPRGISLILMDLSLRGSEDGLVLAQSIRENSDFEDVPIIVTSAHAFVEDRTRALAAGCDGYLAKPFGRAELFSVIDRL